MHINRVEKVLREYLDKGAGKLTKQRKIIIDVFAKADAHLTIDELYNRIKLRHPHIGMATVYRTMKLLCECGLASGFKHSDGTFRYELEQEHHNHLTCIKCGGLIEDTDSQIEILQNKLAQKHKFKILLTRLELYGICHQCL